MVETLDIRYGYDGGLYGHVCYRFVTVLVVVVFGTSKCKYE